MARRGPFRTIVRMNDSDRLNPGHGAVRGFLRVAGPLFLVCGLIFIIVGTANFFMAFGDSGPPRLFWCNFVGVPLAFVGGVMSSYGFMGAVLRYQAAEAAPVGKDTINYVASGVKPAIKDVTQAMVEGISSAKMGQYCTQCGAANDLDARFCKACGRGMSG
jgi:zinc-ribbon domain